MKKFVYLATSVVFVANAYGMQNDYLDHKTNNKRKISELSEIEAEIERDFISKSKGKRRCSEFDYDDDMFDELEDKKYQNINIINAEYLMASMADLEYYLEENFVIERLDQLKVYLNPDEMLNWSLMQQFVLLASKTLKKLNICDEKGGIILYNLKGNRLLVNKYNTVNGLNYLSKFGEKNNYSILDLVERNLENENFSCGLFPIGKGIVRFDLDILKNFKPEKITDILITRDDLVKESWKGLNFSKISGLAIADNSLDKKEMSIDEISKLNQLIDCVKSNVKILDFSGNNLKKLPEAIIKCKNLVELNLEENEELSYFPLWFKDLKIQRLNLSNSMLNRSDFPEEICELSNLKELDFSSGSNGVLLNVSSKINNLKNLEILNFSGRYIPNLPKEIWDLKNLKILDVSNCGLEEVTAEIAKLSNLKALSLAGNDIRVLPLNMIMLKNLESLDVSGLINIEYFVSEMDNFKNLQRLGLFSCGLKVLPLKLDKLNYLRELNLQNNELTRIPFELENSSSLVSVNLCNNKLNPSQYSLLGQSNIQELLIDNFIAVKKREFFSKVSVPHIKVLNSKKEEHAFRIMEGGNFIDLERIALDINFLARVSVENLEFPKLKILKIYNKFGWNMDYTENLDKLIKKVAPTIHVLIINDVCLGRMPYAILKCGKLRKLELVGCKLENVDGIDWLRNLEYLNLRGNQLKSLTNSIGNLRKLQRLFLGKNLLIYLPSTVVNLKNLSELGIEKNLLTRYPKQLSRLKNLNSLNISENLIEEIPEDINDLKNLKNLVVESDVLKKLPDIKGPVSISFLNQDMSVNRFIEDKDVYEDNNYLPKIDLSNRGLNQVPPDIVNYNTEEIDISNNPLKSVPAYLSLIEDLKKLDLKETEIHSVNEIPDEIFGMKSLESIVISEKQWPEVLDQDNNIWVNLLGIDENENFIIEHVKDGIEKIRLERIKKLLDKKREIEKEKIDIFSSHLGVMAYQKMDPKVTQRIMGVYGIKFEKLKDEEGAVNNKVKMLRSASKGNQRFDNSSVT